MEWKKKRNQRNREGRKEFTPSKITIRKGTVSFFFFFPFFGETHTHTRWNWVDLDWIQSVLTVHVLDHVHTREDHTLSSVHVSLSFSSLVLLCRNSTEPPFVNILIKSSPPSFRLAFASHLLIEMFPNNGKNTHILDFKFTLFVEN